MHKMRLVVICLCWLSQARSYADRIVQTGHQCLKSNDYLGTISYSDSGALNTTTTQTGVSCPVTWKKQASSIDSADTTDVTYMDGSTGSGLASSFYCYGLAQDWYGNIFGGATRHSCATYGGCSAFTQYSSTPFTNVLTIPAIGNGSVPWASYVVDCLIPNSSILFSYATTY